MNPDSVSISTPVVHVRRNGTCTVSDGAGIHHYPSADVAMEYHALIVQLVGREQQRALEAEQAAEETAKRAG